MFNAQNIIFSNLDSEKMINAKVEPFPCIKSYVNVTENWKVFDNHNGLVLKINLSLPADRAVGTDNS